ncbi:MAG: hypothetical protein Q8K82_13175 [Gemmatimonadaceae bacterium]|nr:hypothetical protein [Gemmatimonadaceae bacterium]
MFKGARSYIQGGDVVNRLQDVTPDLLGDPGLWVSSIAFRRFTHLDCRVSADPPDRERLVADVWVTGTTGTKTSLWLEETDAAPAGRYEFNEQAIIASATCEGEEITAPRADFCSAVELAIALTKELNYRLSPEPDGRWVFGQLSLTERLPAAFSQLRVRRRSAIPGRFSVNELWFDGRFVGTMRFIVGSP